jgi:restriction endonuclease S subunit
VTVQVSEKNISYNHKNSQIISPLFKVTYKHDNKIRKYQNNPTSRIKFKLNIFSRKVLIVNFIARYSPLKKPKIWYFLYFFLNSNIKEIL